MDQETYPVIRELDGVYTRVQRDGKYLNVCFTDLTANEQQEFLNRMDENGLKRMCIILAESVRGLGDHFDIVRRDAEDEE